MSLIQYIKNNKTLLYHIEIKRIKHTYLKIKQGYVLVTTNKRMVRIVESFIDKQFDKLYDNISKQIKPDNKSIQLSGKTYAYVFEKGSFHYEINDTSVIAYGKDSEQTKKAIYLNEIKRMMATIHQEVLEVVKPYHFSQVPIKYKYLKSKFGSYHKKHHEITLNTILATLEPIYLKYVLFHEYAHTKVFNHSPQFYQCLDRLMPGHKTIQKRLKNVVII